MTNTYLPDHSRTWVLSGGLSGAVGVFAYFGAAFLPVPDIVGLVLAFAFGPLIAIASLGLAQALINGPPRVGAQVAAFLGAAAGIVVLAMLTVQQALFAAYENIPGTDTARTSLIALGDAVHFGLDIAWDCLISASIVLFALQMWGSPPFGRIFSTLGVVFGLLLFGINIAAFPSPPDSIGWVDMGPFCALWMLAVYIRMCMAGRDRKRKDGLTPARS
ncbi:MAG TPA: hypothetical protein PLB89_10215 [Flavobacteriales bacterium]|nr:hypothetical protein [Flavobacteriales bacterium]